MNFNCSKLFDSLRDMYAKINYSRFMEEKNRAILPLRYSFELTHRCNLKCPYCYVGSDRVKEEMTTDEWFSVIEQVPFYSFISLVGGEPLLREDFCEILEAASKKTLGKVNVVTNGTLINDNIISSFIRSKLLLLSVSLDGWGELHDKHRGCAGAFNKITENLDNLSLQCRAADSKLMVDIKTIVLEDNLEDILKLYQHASNKGFEFLSVSFLRNNDLKQNAKLRENFDREFYKENYEIKSYFDLEKFEEIYLEIQKMRKYSKTKIRFAPKFDNEDSNIELNLIKKFFTKYKDISPRQIYEPCLYPFSNTIINPSGDIYPCLSYKIGNIKDNKLKDIIQDRKYCDFRTNLKYSRVFSGCQMCCELKVKDI